MNKLATQPSVIRNVARLQYKVAEMYYFVNEIRQWRMTLLHLFGVGILSHFQSLSFKDSRTAFLSLWLDIR